MNQELQALASNNTWYVVLLPPGKKPIRSKWVYKIKLNSDGSLERYKAPLIAKVTTRNTGLIFQKFSAFYSLLLINNGVYFNMMLIMDFSMVILMKKFTRLYLRTYLTLLINILHITEVKLWFKTSLKIVVC